MTSQGSIEAPNQLLLNCHIQGDHYEDIIEIRIDATLQVTRLKEMIEEKSKNRFQIADMIIWRVSIPRDEHLRETLYRFKFTESSNVKPLWPSHSLAEYFQAVPPEENHLHIRVQKISYYSLQDIKRCLFDDDIQETNNRLREELKDNWPPLPPSILAAKPNSEFLLNPNNKASRFLCGRPSKAEFGIPIVLLHPVFAQFMDDCEEYTPTAEDYSFVKELSTRMCEHYAEKWDRRTAFQNVLPKYRIYLYAALIEGTQYLADHHAILNPHMYLSTACNDEMGDGGSDPYLKSGINHALSIIHMEEMKANMGPMPCFHIYYSGMLFIKLDYDLLLIPI
ncbi:hypothetical protein FRC02_011888 [Tulasnella sp. 418]|nr:hypothetical protein FRC02_011888 [Tulasnella sp. 418]